MPGQAGAGKRARTSGRGPYGKRPQRRWHLARQTFRRKFDPHHPPRIRAARLAECKPRPRRHGLALVPQLAQLGALLAPRAERVDVCHVRLHRLNIINSRERGHGDEGRERAGLADGLGAPKPGWGEGDARTETLHGA